MSDIRIYLSHPETARAWWYGDAALTGLRSLGTVELNRSETSPDGERLVAEAQGCQIIVVDRATAITSSEMAQLPDLVALVRSGVEVRHIDIEAASDLGILVTQARPGYIASTAELILAHILNSARDIPDYVLSYRKGEQRRPSHGRELSGSTAGLIGYGRIARHLTKILDAIGMRVLAFDPYATIDPPAIGVELDQLLAQSDFVVPILAATAQTRNLIDASAIAKMKPGVRLINCSRGDVINEAALLAALDTGHIAGAGLDVGMGYDQTPSMELGRHPRVFGTPHIGNLTVEAAARHPADTVAQATDILAGRIPFGAINAENARRVRDRLRITD